MKGYTLSVIAGALLAALLGIHRCEQCDGRGWVVGHG